MSTIEERVVGMKFDNTKFGPGVKSSIADLGALNKALKMEGATQGLAEVEKTAGKFSLQGMKNAVTGVLGQFSALQVAAITALSNIVNKAVEAGLQIAKSLTVAPVLDGFHEYETNLNSIQTILANTGLKGAAGLAKVNTALQDLNTYSDKTIYNFTEMAKNIGTFTAAGIDLKTSTAAIKGIANLAAISGSNSEQASTAMYQLSQALAAGKVSLEDWNSVVNAGMGGKVFQNALIETARVHGVAVDKIIKDEGGFRNSLQKGWITSSILTETLSKFTGELTADQLKSMGYNEKQIAGILEMGKTATNAATKVKTFSQLIDTLKEAVGSGWTQTWQILFGNFDEATSLFTGVSNTLGKMIGDSAKARNDLLQGWKDLGGRKALIDGIGNAFHALLSFIQPIKDAFREIFPKTTAKELFAMTVAFRDFMAKLKLGSDTANNLRRTFAGFFAILGIGWELIKAGVKFFFNLFGSITKGSGGFLKFTGNLGDFLVGLHKAIQEGQGFTKFFEFLSKVLQVPINLIKALIGWVVSLFHGFGGADHAAAGVQKLGQALTPLQKIGEKLKQLWDKIKEIFANFFANLGPIGERFSQFIQDLGDAFANAFSNLDGDKILSGINTGLFAGLLLLFKKFIGKFGEFKLDGGLLDGVKEAIEGLTGTLSGMQHALNATALLAIAIAIGVLTLSFIALAKIDADGMQRASIAIGVMMGELAAAFVAFNKISSGGSALKIGVMSAGLILLAIAIRILASSVAKLAGMKIDELKKGLTAVAVLLGILVFMTNRLDTVAPGMIRTAAGMIILATAIKLLVSSVQELGGMDWVSLAKGLIGVGTLLGALALFTRIADANKAGVLQGTGILILATALKVLASATGDFAKYNWVELSKGMAGIGTGLGLIALAMNLLPAEGAVLRAAGVAIIAASLKLIAEGVKEMSGMQWMEIARGMTVLAGSLIAISVALKILSGGNVLKAAGILIVAASLSLIQKALGNMAGMTWEQIAKGLTVLASALLLISAALVVVQGSIAGAVAITIMAAALNLLVLVMKALGAMDWGSIIKALVALAGIFVILAAAGLLLGPLAPVIFLLAAAIALLGAGIGLAGAGVLAFAAALTILATAGAAGVAVVIALIKGLASSIPDILIGLAKGIVAFATIIAQSGPQMTAALITILNAILDAIIQTTPKALQALEIMLTGLLALLVRMIPKMVDAGLKLIIGLLDGLSKNMPQIVDKGTDVVVKLLQGIGRNSGKILQAGIDMVLGILKGIGQAALDLVKKGLELAGNLISGLVQGIKNGVQSVLTSIVDLGSQIDDKMRELLDTHSPSRLFMWFGHMIGAGLVIGIDDYNDKTADAAGNLGSGVIDSMGRSLTGLSKVLGSDLIDFEPTITPVLDLSNVKRNASQISDLLSAGSLDISGTYSAAKDAGSAYEANRTTESTDGSSGGGDTYNYTQNNTSPKALSDAEIYRQTKNLISRTKEDAGAR